MDNIKKRFMNYHQSNPEVYSLLVKFARTVKSAGRKKYSIGALFERLRWHYDITSASAEPFKLSNDYRPEYSRLIMKKEPDLKGFFATKKLFAACR